MRVGDVIDHDVHTVQQMLCAPVTATGRSISRHIYARPMAHYALAARALTDMGIRTVTLVVGSIYPVKDADQSAGPPNLKSCAYVQAVATFLRRSNLTVGIRNTSPDADFAWMSSSAVYIPSGGGYSELVAAMVRLSRGVVLPMPQMNESGPAPHSPAAVEAVDALCAGGA